MFHVAGVDKARFMDDVRANPPTYSDWSSGEWTVETDGKEDEMFSPFLKKPFETARKMQGSSPPISRPSRELGARCMIAVR